MACFIIYALQLEQGKYYVGKTHRSEGVELRFEEHLRGRGCEWTKLYKPLSVVESYEHYSTLEDNILTKKYMMKYGIDNVRGDSCAKIELEEWLVKSLEHEFQSVSDKCFKCGKPGHFAKDCGKGLFLEYLSTFETEETIEQEIDRLENVIKNANQLHAWIFHYKYMQIINDKKQSIVIEIEPSIIDTYNMRHLEWDDRRFCNNPNPEIHEKIYANVLKYKGDGNKPNIVDYKNVVQNIYKVYVYRRKLERQYLEIYENENKDHEPNVVTIDELIKLLNTKIELLYQKLATLI